MFVYTDMSVYNRSSSLQSWSLLPLAFESFSLLRCLLALWVASYLKNSYCVLRADIYRQLSCESLGCYWNFFWRVSNVVSHPRLQFRFSWNLVSCCVSRRHGQRSNVLAVFISLSGSKIRPCFALLFFTIKFTFKFKVHAKYIVIKI